MNSISSNQYRYIRFPQKLADRDCNSIRFEVCSRAGAFIRGDLFYYSLLQKSKLNIGKPPVFPLMICSGSLSLIVASQKGKTSGFRLIMQRWLQ